MATYGFSKEGAKRVRDVVDWAERRGARTYRRHKRRRMAGDVFPPDEFFAGTANSLAICVSDIPMSTIPDFSSESEVGAWEYEVGQDGVAADRRSTFDDDGETFVAYDGEAGVVLVDWKKSYDHEDLSTYIDAEYVDPKVHLAPIVECFNGWDHVGGGLGGTEGQGTGLGGGGNRHGSGGGI